MLRTDTGNFNRFLSSIGLLLILGALLVPYFYFHDTDTLRISRHELGGLTNVGREALETRQKRTSDLEIPVLILAGALALSGIAGLMAGGKRLRQAQVKEDAAIDRKARRDDTEIEQMSESEVEERRDEQALEAVQQDAAAADQATPEQPRPAIRAETDVQDLIAQNRTAIARIENELRAILSRATFKAHDFFPEVKTARQGQQIVLDGLFRAHSRDGGDVVLELKVVSQSRSLRRSVRNTADAVLAHVTRYRAISSRPASAWLLVVLPEDVEEPALDERRELEDLLGSSLIGMGRATILNERDLLELPSRFVGLFESQAK
jgi:hypothetical protein